MYEVTINSNDDVLLAQYYTRQLLKSLNFSKFEQQQVLVCVSELTNNIIKHSGVQGIFKCYSTGDEITIYVCDKGKGIENVSDVIEGKVPSHNGLGLGLPGSKQLMDKFFIESKKGMGVTIIAVKKRK